MCAYLDAGGKTAGLLFWEKMSQGGLSRTKHRVPALERWENTDIKTTVCAECAFVCFCVSLKWISWAINVKGFGRAQVRFRKRVQWELWDYEQTTFKLNSIAFAAARVAFYPENTFTLARCTSICNSSGLKIRRPRLLSVAMVMVIVSGAPLMLAFNGQVACA